MDRETYKQNARRVYEEACNALEKFCQEETELTPAINERAYPFTVDFVPDGQRSMFDDESETGEVGTLRVICGTEVKVESTAQIEISETELKKLIKLARVAGAAYYHRFRAEA